LQLLSRVRKASVAVQPGGRREASQPSGLNITPTAETDDRGEYRVGDLAAGTYVVSVSTFGEVRGLEIRPGQMAFAPSINNLYYPNADSQEAAQPITVAAGADQEGIDFIAPLNRSGNQPFSVMRDMGMRRLTSTNARPGATAAIRGTVYSSGARALPYAQVLLDAVGVFDRPMLARADGAGHFSFDSLAAGRYRVSASKAGHFPSGPAAAVVVVQDGENRDRADVTLRPWSVLSGRVLDEFSDPVQGARVQLLQLRYEAGHRQLTPVGPSALTNDEGAYRVYGLSRGSYIVSAAVGSVTTMDVPGYALTYYPGTAAPAQAQFVTLGDGDEVGAIDVALERTRTAHVRGRIIGADGLPSMGGSVTLRPSSRSQSVVAIPVGARLQNGAFEFPNVPRGQYVIQAYLGRSRGFIEGEFGSLLVNVTDRDVSNLVLQMSRGTRATDAFVSIRLIHRRSCPSHKLN